MTYTFVVMDVSPSTYDEIKAKLEAAGYDQALIDQGGAVLLDMHGIALLKADTAP